MTTRAIQIESLLDPIVDYRDNSIASGYTVYFYSAGTSSPKNVWTEKEKTNPYTSRTLGSDGSVQLYGDGVYKIVIKDGDGTTVYSWDNIKVQANTFTVQNKSGTYTATADDDLILCDGTFTVNIATVAGFTHPLIIKRISGTVTVDPYSTETIDGSATISLTASDDSVVLYPDVAASVWRRADSLSGLTATVAELNQLSGVVVGGTGSGDILTTDGAQNITLKTGLDIDGDGDISGTLTLSKGSGNSLTTTANINAGSLSFGGTDVPNFFAYSSACIHRSIFVYNGGATAYTVKTGGGFYRVQDKLAYWDSELTTSAIPTPSASTRYYLYLDYSAITSKTAITSNELIWSSTAPTYSHQYKGLFNGSDLCILSVITNGTPDDILIFYHDGGTYVSFEDQYSVGTITSQTSWVDLDISGYVPNFGETKAHMTFASSAVSSGGASYVFYRKNGSSGSGHLISAGYTSGSVSYDTGSIDVFTDTSQIIEWMHDTNHATTTGYVDGFYLPQGM